MHITLHNPKSKVLPSLPFFKVPKFEAWSRLPFAQALIAAPKVMIFDEFPRSWKKARHSSHLRRWALYLTMESMDFGWGFRNNHGVHASWHDVCFCNQKKNVRWMLPLSRNLLVNSTTNGSPETDLRRSYWPAIAVRRRYGNYKFTHKCRPAKHGCGHGDMVQTWVLPNWMFSSVFYHRYWPTSVNPPENRWHSGLGQDAGPLSHKHSSSHRS